MLFSILKDKLFFPQAVDIKLLGCLNRDDLKKICGDNFPEWISFPVYEQVSTFTFTMYIISCNLRISFISPQLVTEVFKDNFSVILQPNS